MIPGYWKPRGPDIARIKDIPGCGYPGGAEEAQLRSRQSRRGQRRSNRSSVRVSGEIKALVEYISQLAKVKARRAEHIDPTGNPSQVITSKAKSPGAVEVVRL